MAKFNVGDKVSSGGNKPTTLVVQAVKDGGLYSVMTLDGKHGFDVKEGDIREIKTREPKQ